MKILYQPASFGLSQVNYYNFSLFLSSFDVPCLSSSAFCIKFNRGRKKEKVEWACSFSPPPLCFWLFCLHWSLLYLDSVIPCYKFIYFNLYLSLLYLRWLWMPESCLQQVQIFVEKTFLYRYRVSSSSNPLESVFIGLYNAPKNRWEGLSIKVQIVSSLHSLGQ